MVASRIATYLNRSNKVLRDKAAGILGMQGAEMPSRIPRTLFTFNSREDLSQFVTGCDADIGGSSTVHLDLAEDPARNKSIGKPATGRFWGEMRLGVRTGLEGKVRGGYAGFRNKYRPTIWGEQTDDVSHHRYLALRLRAGGHPRTRNSYFVNIQTDGPVTSDLWQHRLYFARKDSGWEDIFIPFDDFVLTNAGEMASAQVTMSRERIRTIGVSLLGGNSGVEGPYELGIDEIRAVNEEDVTVPPEKGPAEDIKEERAAL